MESPHIGHRNSHTNQQLASFLMHHHRFSRLLQKKLVGPGTREKRNTLLQPV